MQQQCPRLQLHNSEDMGEWLSQLALSCWNEAMLWLDKRLKDPRSTTERSWNDHWNNHVRFCNAVEAYLNLCYSIKNGDIGLLRDALREVCIILQASSANKTKYARETFRQLHIIDTSAADMVLQKAYLANALVNLQGKAKCFYEMDLLLEHQNGAFKRFRSDRGSSLQETDQMFRLNALTVDALAKVRQVMNRVIIGRERDSYHPTKNSSFDILSLADQLHRSRSTTPEGPEPRKVYFSLNPMPDLFAEGVQALFPNVKAYNLSLEKTEVLSTETSYNPGSSFENPMDLDAGSNEVVNELFGAAREASSVTSNLANVNL